MPKNELNNNTSIDLTTLKNIYEKDNKIINKGFNIFSVYKTFDEPFKNIESLSCHLDQYYGKYANKYWNEIQFGQRSARFSHIVSKNGYETKNYSFKENDIFEVCVEKMYVKQYYVYFIKNNDIIRNTYGSNGIFRFFNGKQKLNFDKFDYLFGLTCVSCNCKNCKGFEFKVTFKQY